MKTSGEAMISKPAEWCSPIHASSKPSVSRCSMSWRSRSSARVGFWPTGWNGARKIPNFRCSAGGLVPCVGAMSSCPPGCQVRGAAVPSTAAVRHRGRAVHLSAVEGQRVPAEPRRAMASKYPTNPSPSERPEEDPGRTRPRGLAHAGPPTASTYQALPAAVLEGHGPLVGGPDAAGGHEDPVVGQQRRCRPSPSRRTARAAAVAGESTGPSYSSTRTGSPPPRAELWS